jgi:hypothetical protein
MTINLNTLYLHFLKKFGPAYTNTSFWGLILFISFPIFANGQVTLEFQDGFHPSPAYSGTNDANLSEMLPNENLGSENSLLLDGEHPVATRKDMSVLLKWDLSLIPQNSTVQSVTFTLNVTNRSENSYELFEIKKEWVEDKVSWNFYDGINLWETPGAKGADDRGAVILAKYFAYWKGIQTITLNTAGIALVQSWVTNPDSNHGFIFANESSWDGIGFDSSENASPMFRPRLSVTYINSGTALNNPPFISINKPTKGLRFTAKENITISADASDRDGNVTLVEYFNGAAKLGQTHSSPWKFIWKNVSVGNYKLTAVATDDAGATTTSLPVDVMVTPPNYIPPSIVRQIPANGESGFSLNPKLTVNVTGADLKTLESTFFGRKATSEDFTIIHWSDPQHYAEKYPATYKRLTNWIRNKQDSLNIKFVSLSGDCVQHADKTIEWDRANTALGTLESAIPNIFPNGIPYGISPGNYDQYPQNSPAGTNNYNSYFGISRFQGRSYYGGNFNGIDNDNHYTLFRAGGMNFIMIFLEYDDNPNPAVLSWADNLLSSFSSYKAIIVSHHIMNVGQQASFGNQGRAIYEALKENPNLFLMLGGHEHGEGKRVDIYNGNAVHTLLANYQDLHNGGDGWIRILKFSPGENEIHVQTYSPILNRFGKDPTMEANTTSAEFVLNWDMNNKNSYTMLSTAKKIQSGKNISISWPNLSPQSTYEWFVEVSDDISTTTSPVYTFKTSGTSHNTPPDIAITTPLANTTFTEADEIRIAAGSFDTNGTITNVEFYHGATKIGEDDTLPFEISWKNAGAGSYSLIAVATNNYGESATSNSIKIKVYPAGSQITQNFQDGRFPSSTYWGTKDAYLNEVQSTRNYGMENVLIIDGDDPPGSGYDKYILLKWDLSLIPPNSIIQAASVKIDVTNRSESSYELYEIKKDWMEDKATWNFSGGLKSWQRPGAKGPDDRGEVVLARLLAEETGPKTITLNADGIAQVQFWVNNPNSNFGFILANHSSLNGIDFVSSENCTPTSRPSLSVTYLDSGKPPNSPPIVSINNPTNGSHISTKDVSISADASDTDGNVVLVEFFQGVTKIGECHSSPWEITWDHVSAGNYSICAKATDNKGAVSKSDNILITVQSGNEQVLLDFQNGIFPSPNYLGAKDAYLSEAEPNENFSLENRLLLDGDDPPSSAKDKSTLLKWELSSIPKNSIVQSAKITLQVANSSTNIFKLFTLLKDWNQDQVTWNLSDNTYPWQSPGAKGPDDRGNKILGTLSAFWSGFHSMTLNATGIAAVQSWVDNPDSNFGFIIAHNTSSNGVEFFSSKVSTPPNRPRLSITYLKPQELIRLAEAEALSSKKDKTSALGAKFKKWIKKKLNFNGFPNTLKTNIHLLLNIAGKMVIIRESLLF